MPTLLEIISGDEFGAAVLCGVAAPTSLFGSTDPNAPLFTRLANQEGRSLARRHNWRALRVDHTQVTIAAESQSSLPIDYDRLVPDAELWNRTLGMKYDFPTADDTWARLKGIGVNSAAPGYARLIGAAATIVQITPAPAAGQTLALTYMSKNWVVAENGAGKASFTLDSDSPRLPASLLMLGVIWRWKQSRGFDYAEDLATYEREVELAASRDRGTAVIEVGKSGSADTVAGTTWPGVVSA